MTLISGADLHQHLKGVSHKNAASQNSSSGNGTLEPETNEVNSGAGDNDCYQIHENLPLKGSF